MNFVRSRLHWIFAALCICFVAALPFRHVTPTVPGDIEAFRQAKLARLVQPILDRAG